MKRYTPKLISRWILAKNLIPADKLAKPFPGKAPTRIMINAIAGKRIFRYIGKPSLSVLREFYNFSKIPIVNRDYYLVYVEFDKSTIITMTKSRANCIPESKRNVKLWEHYHPEIAVEELPNWLNWPYKVVNGTYKIV